MRRRLATAGALVLLAAAPLVAASPAPRGFVEIAGAPFVVDLRYATGDNFLGRNVYAEHGVDRCWVHPVMAERLARLAPLLEGRGMTLVLWDCWRPLAVQKAMWKIMPDPRYVADPKKGSNHNRGLALDASLGDAQGKPLAMPTAFDDFTEKAAPTAACARAEKNRCANRDLQIRLMHEAGLEPLPTEWWHYQPTGVAVETYPVR